MIKNPEFLPPSRETLEDHGELRYVTVAKSDDRMIVMVWTPRGEARRIVSNEESK